MKKNYPLQSWLLLLVLCIGSNCFSQNVGINSTGANPNASAGLDIDFTNKGTLITRMNTTQRDAIATSCSCTPSEGLMIFNTTTKCLEMYVNSAWSTVSCPSNCIQPSTPVVTAATGATETQITANWNTASSATAYHLDVSTVNTFATFVSGYNDLNVGNVLTYNITGLSNTTVYYYRVRAVSSCGASGNSNVISATTLSSLSAGIVAYWRMDESSGNPVDYSGNGHTLSNQNSCPFSNSFGKIHNGISFNGSNQDATCSDAGFPTGSTDRTFACWINFPSTPSNSSGIMAYGASSQHHATGILWANTGDILIGAYADDFTFDTNLSNGTWYHIAFTVSNGGQDITLYINGSLFGTSTGHAFNTNLAGTLYLGYQPFNGIYCVNYMDEIGVWSRALTDVEIATLYNGGAGFQVF